jgi:hypothetical protein
VCETWYVILRKEHRVRAFKNRVLRKMFGSRRDVFPGGWMRLHSEELVKYYSG